MEIKDTGNRKEFPTGAVRDISDGAGKGRCDLLPLDIIGSIMGDDFLLAVDDIVTGQTESSFDDAIAQLIDNYFDSWEDAWLELSKHFEAGSRKYGERNWEKGIPLHCYIDSAVRHYLKFKRGDDDEPHLVACLWNLVCGHWTRCHHPELNDMRGGSNG